MASIARAREDFSLMPSKNEAHSSGVSWAAVLAGAFVTASLSLILIALGTGIGLSSISPWANQGASASTVGVGAILWLILIQVVASAMGGYLAGRLRTKWVEIHSHEVYFRDTAHGFLVWSVGLVITVIFFASAAGSLAGKASGEGIGTSGDAISAPYANQYYVDSLFRSASPAPEANDASIRAQAAVILANALRQPDIPPQDKNYLVSLVESRTGLMQPEADARVSQTVAAERQAADEARKNLAHSMYWLFLALLIGAFCASYAATMGGRQRDRVLL